MSKGKIGEPVLVKPKPRQEKRSPSGPVYDSREWIPHRGQNVKFVVAVIECPYQRNRLLFKADLNRRIVEHIHRIPHDKKKSHVFDDNWYETGTFIDDPYWQCFFYYWRVGGNYCLYWTALMHASKKRKGLWGVYVMNDIDRVSFPNNQIKVPTSVGIDFDFYKESGRHPLRFEYSFGY